MFGFSIFLNEDLSSKKKSYIEKMAANGFTGIFTSLHIPEDDATLYRSRLTELGKISKELTLDLMVDISGNALHRAGYSFDNLKKLQASGLSGLRIDDRISNQTIAQLSNRIQIALNASTMTELDMQELQNAKANFNNLEAWHNYYPRPDTALDRTWYSEKNKWLKSYGFRIQAFVPGDQHLRGPLHQGLPTVEKHRYMNPFAATLDLLGETDQIYVGDDGLSASCMKQFAHYNDENEIVLTVEAYDPQIAFALGTHTNRLDEARDVVRSAEARFKTFPEIAPLVPKPREQGSVTLDNVKYLRYQGEIQLVKTSLPKDEKVNVVGRVIEKDRALLRYISGGQKFRIERVEQND